LGVRRMIGVGPIDLLGLTAAAEGREGAAFGNPTHEQPGDLPILVHLLFDAHVLDEDGGVVLAQTQAAVEQIVDDQRLRLALLEAAHIHQTGGADLTGIARGHPPHGHEDAPSDRHLHDYPESSRALERRRSIDGGGIADASDLIPERVEHGRGDESGDEDSFRWTAHGLRLRAESVFSGRANRIEPRSHEAGSLPARLLFITWTLLLHLLVDPPP